MGSQFDYSPLQRGEVPLLGRFPVPRICRWESTVSYERYTSAKPKTLKVFFFIVMFSSKLIKTQRCMHYFEK